MSCSMGERGTDLSGRQVHRKAGSDSDGLVGIHSVQPPNRRLHRAACQRCAAEGSYVWGRVRLSVGPRGSSRGPNLRGQRGPPRALRAGRLTPGRGMRSSGPAGGATNVTHLSTLLRNAAYGTNSRCKDTYSAATTRDLEPPLRRNPRGDADRFVGGITSPDRHRTLSDAERRHPLARRRSTRRRDGEPRPRRRSGGGPLVLVRSA